LISAPCRNGIWLIASRSVVWVRFVRFDVILTFGRRVKFAQAPAWPRSARRASAMAFGFAFELLHDAL